MLRNAALVGLSLLVLSGCKKEEPPPPPPPPVTPAPPPPPPPVPFRVTGADLGKGIQPDNTVQTVTDTFGPKDTIYLSVTSVGMAPQAVLVARWTFGPKDVPVHDETRTLTPQSEKPLHTEFHVSKPSGWPPGNYKVVVTADGQAVQTKTFTVSKTAGAPGKKH
ncbi:MAG TPA: hypothetical protein VMH40_18325 [Myxococcaceae bacterium]|nr:hypothetical protein [Myxococcaceae bacterium]